MNGATTIQERLKDLRLNKGLKLEELAEQTGISKSALGSYEKDDYKEINHGNLKAPPRRGINPIPFMSRKRGRRKSGVCCGQAFL